MIRQSIRIGLGVFLFGLVAACYGGSGSVYVGVAAPGPWVGYPYPYPGVPGVTVGYPPYYWDDEDQDQDTDEREESEGARDAADGAEREASAGPAHDGPR